MTTRMIGPFKHSKEANEACDAANAARPPLTDDEPLPRGRWFVFDTHGYWLRWAPPGPFNEPTRNCTISPEIRAFLEQNRMEVTYDPTTRSFVRP